MRSAHTQPNTHVVSPMINACSNSEGLLVSGQMALAMASICGAKAGLRQLMLASPFAGHCGWRVSCQPPGPRFLASSAVPPVRLDLLLGAHPQSPSGFSPACASGAAPAVSADGMRSLEVSAAAAAAAFEP